MAASWTLECLLYVRTSPTRLRKKKQWKFQVEISSSELYPETVGSRSNHPLSKPIATRTINSNRMTGLEDQRVDNQRQSKGAPQAKPKCASPEILRSGAEAQVADEKKSY